MEHKTKSCGKCHKEKTLDNFSFNSSTGYYNSYCKPCAVDYQRELREKKKEKKREEFLETRKSENVFANILSRKRLTDDQNNV